MPRVHVTTARFFPLSQVDPNSIYSSLKTGLARTFRALPLLAGTIKPTSAGRQHGRLVVTAPWQTVDEAFHLVDLRGRSELDYAQLRATHFPTHRWSLLMAVEVGGAPSPQALEQPVLRATLAIIRGGYVFSLHLHHSFTDGNGTATISRIWCTACANESQTETFDGASISRDRLMGEPNVDLSAFPFFKYVDESESLADAARLRFHISKGMDDTRTLAKTDSLFVRLFGLIGRWLEAGLGAINISVGSVPSALRASAGRTSVSTTPPLQRKNETRMLFFPQSNLVELKALATTNWQSCGDSRWISTQDAICSLLWCAVGTARRSCGRAPQGMDNNRAQQEEQSYSKYSGDEAAVFGTVMNARHLLTPPLSPNFIGNVVLWVHVVAPIKRLQSTPNHLSTHAYALRDQYREKDTSYLQRFVSALSSVRDISRVHFAQLPNPELSFALSSWRDQTSYDEDWGKVFGSDCDRLRWLGPLPDQLAIVMPELRGSTCKSSAAGLEVVVGFTDDILPHLQRDEMLNRFAEWR